MLRPQVLASVVPTSGMKLPSKGENFDWSLGPGVASIGQQHDADYALFVHYRDYQASGGRVAFAILAAAAGVGVPMGGEMGFASLVDLKTGDIVWFPVTQAFYTGLLGWGLAIAIYFAAAYAINQMLSGQLAEGQQVCVLLPVHFVLALGLTVGAAVFAAALAGMRSARIEPSDGLREI